MPPRGSMRAPAKPKNAKGTILRLLAYLKPHKTKLILVAVCIVASTLVSTTGTYLLREVVNSFLEPLLRQKEARGMVFLEDFVPFARFLVMMLCMYVAGALSVLVYNRLMMLVSTATLNKVRKDMFNHMEDLPIRYFDQRTHGEIMSRYTNDTDTLREFLSQSFPQAISSLFSIIFCLFYMVRLNIWLTLLVLVLMPVMLYVTTQIGKRSGKNFVAQQKAASSRKPSRGSGWCRCSATRSRPRPISQNGTRMCGRPAPGPIPSPACWAPS